MRILEGHTGPVRCLAYSPDGELLASGGGDGKILLWKRATGEQIRLVGEHTDQVRALAFVLEGALLLSGSWDNSVRIWTATLRRTKTKAVHPKEIAFHQGGTWALAWCPLSGCLVTGGGMGEVRLYPLFTGKPSAEKPVTLTGHTRPVAALAFSRDGSTLVTASHDNTVRLWDGQWGKRRGVLGPYGDWLRAVAVSANGKVIAAAGDEGVIHLADGTSRRSTGDLSGHVTPVTGLSFQPGDQTLLSVGWDGTARMWNVAAGAEMAAYAWEAGKLLCLAVSGDGMTAAAGSESGAIVLWDLDG